GRMIGFGTLPWQWLQPVLGYAPVTALLNVIYDCWFLIMFACLLWQAFAARSNETRMQFLLAFAFSWFIAGNVLATIFSSAGPCFYGYLHPGADPFGAQMAYLQNVNTQWPVWSLQIQDALWQSYVTGSGAVAGISAFPSMHVTIAVLLALLGTRTNRWLGIALWIFAGLIVIGSVHLAWHYAADSLAGIALAMLFWWSAGVVTRTWQKRCKVSSHDLPAPIC
ncbi:MAG TPA: phosphatase PAP2 family protein, partial [Rhizomicrobium sp.]|nr:phosphatase PAP2 family protein [Rhizomicrobium sp.]